MQSLLIFCTIASIPSPFIFYRMSKNTVQVDSSSSKKEPAMAINALALKLQKAFDQLALKGAVPEDAIEVGRIMGAWGVKGGVKLHPFSEQADALLAAKRWIVLPAERGAKSFESALDIEVDRVRAHSDSYVAQLTNIDDRDIAQALKGARICILRTDFPELDGKDEFYWVDLIGLTVINRQGVVLGQVKELISNGPQSVLVLQRATDSSSASESEPKTLGDDSSSSAQGAKAKSKSKSKAKKVASESHEILIPFVGAFIDEVKLSERCILVDWQPDY